MSQAFASVNHDAAEVIEFHDGDVVKLKGLKASGFAGRMLPGQGSGVVTDCDEFTPPEECESIPF